VKLEVKVPVDFTRGRHRCGDIERRIAGSEMHRMMNFEWQLASLAIDETCVLRHERLESTVVEARHVDKYQSAVYNI
jgi:hypothetical protein